MFCLVDNRSITDCRKQNRNITLPTTEIKNFLPADAVTCGLPNQNTPNGYYNIERMLKLVIRNGGEIKSFGACSEARGINKSEFIEGVKLSNMKEFSQWTFECDKVLTL